MTRAAPTMTDAHAFLKALTVVLGVAAVTTVLFQRLRQPVVLGYILAGLVVGPHVPIPLLADRAILGTLSELGVILLMFGLGLEFSVRAVVRVAPTAGVTATIESSIMMWLGFLAGRALGWTTLESVFAGAIVAIASTTIVAKAFGDLRVAGARRDLALGVLLVEDLFAVLLIAVLTAVATGATVSPGAVGHAVARLGAFLAVLIVAGMLVVPPAIRWVRRLGSAETLLVVNLGLCFGISYLALAAGYSVALGAFIAGSLVSESGEGHEVAHLVAPVRDLFAAIFFVSVGTLIEPALVVEHLGATIVFALLVVFGKSAAVALGAFLTGNGIRTSVQTGMSLAQIGEFSFILAALGASLGATGAHLYPIAVAVSAFTALTTPWLIRRSGSAAEYVDRKLPRAVQTAAALYGSWIEQLGHAPDRRTLGARARRIARVIALDAIAIAALVIGTAVLIDRGAPWVRAHLGTGEFLARAALTAAAAALSLPFVAGLARNARRLGLLLAEAALPPGSSGRPDLAAAPRRTLVAMLQLAAALLALLPVVAITQPFLPGIPGAVVLATVIVFLGVGFWRSAANLQGHVRAGAQVIAEALAKHAGARARRRDALVEFRAMFPGMGEPVTVRLTGDAAAVGRTLASLAVRGATGATVLAIARDDGAVMVPGPSEVLRAGDVLALAGTAEAVEAARRLLTTGIVEGGKAPARSA